MTSLYPLLVLLLAVSLTSGAPGRKLSSNNGGVQLEGRTKLHGEREVCPQLTHCKCKSRGPGLDVTCEHVNTYKLKVGIIYTALRYLWASMAAVIYTAMDI